MIGIGRVLKQKWSEMLPLKEAQAKGYRWETTILLRNHWQENSTLTIFFYTFPLHALIFLLADCGILLSSLRPMLVLRTGKTNILCLLTVVDYRNLALNRGTPTCLTC